ncbi:MAG: T9SS type A sorting domain-containing protein [Ignavibacteriae bacterium]|nr:T9SS type A sorting domain-containing protein [Ignavibacteriota bacterium]
MKLRYSILGLVFAVCICYALFLHYSSQPFSSSDGYVNEAQARSEWELMRLRDPATGKIPDGIRFNELKFANTLPRKSDDPKSASLLSSTWTQRGPWNVGGRTRAVAIDIDNENIMLAGGISGGIWRSTDKGEHWTSTFTPAQIKCVTTITQDTRIGKRNIWYCGTGEIWGNSSQLNGDGLLKSTDGGMSWQSLKTTATNSPQTWDGAFEFVWKVATNPKNTAQDEVYAATSLGAIFRSVDGGATWKPVLGNLGNNFSLFTDIAITSTGVLYAAMSSMGGGRQISSVKGMYRSLDGVTWTNITPKDFPDICNRISIGIAPSEENQVYFLANTPSAGLKGLGFEQRTDWNSLWKYTYIALDGTGVGGKWENRSQNLPAFGGEFGDFFSQGSYDLFVRVKPDNPNVVFVGGTNLYRSTDGFTSTSTTSWIGGYKPGTTRPDYELYANQHPDQHELIFSYSNPNAMISANDGGIWKCNDNTLPEPVWSSLNNGYLTTQFYTIALDHSKATSDVIIGGLQDNGTFFVNSTEPTAEWVQPGLGDGSYCAIASGGNYYMSRQQGRIGRFLLDSTGKILQKGRIDPTGGKGYLFIAPFLLDANNEKVMYLAAGSSLWRNKDLTQIPLGKWDSTSVNWDVLPNTFLPSDSISSLGITKTPDSRMYYGTIHGKVYRLDNASDLSSVPKDITGTSFPKGGYVSCTTVDAADGDHVIIAFSNYSVVSLFETTDGGTTWQAVSGNLEQNANGSGSGPSCRWVKILSVGGKNIYYVGTSTGLYSTALLNGENTIWEQEGSETIGNVVVDMIDTRDSDGKVVAATHGNGVFSSTVTQSPLPPAVPTLASPLNNSTNILQSQTLAWNSSVGAVGYQVQVSESSDFSSIFAEQNGLKTTYYDVSNLIQGIKSYYWRVRAFSSGGASIFSEVWKFTTAVAAPALSSPASGTIGLGLPVKARWNKSAGATAYHLQVAQNLGFTSLILDRKDVTETSFDITGLELQKKYYWRVSALNGTQEGSFSTKWNFSTGANGVNEEVKDIFKLRVYPNPLNATGSVQFSLGKSSSIKMAIYDQQGKAVKIILDDFRSAGNYTEHLSNDNLTNGQYYITLIADGIRQTIPVEVRR